MCPYIVHVCGSLVPRPHPIFQCYTENRRAWYMSGHHYCIMPCMYKKVTLRFREDARFELQIWKGRLAVHIRAICTISATNGSIHKTADLWPTHVQLSQFQVCSRWNITHVHSCTRLSHFSVCNIEKLGVAWGQGYVCVCVCVCVYARTLERTCVISKDYFIFFYSRSHSLWRSMLRS